MGIYGERILPRVINLACGTASANPLRERVCRGLSARSWRSGSDRG